MSDPKITIAMPVKDGENYIAETLDCILGQTFGDFKIVIAENASSDATIDILADYARRDSRLIYHCEPKPLGHTPNFNRAMLLSETPWVKLICHDDLLRRDTMAQVVDAVDHAAEQGVGLISTGSCHIFDDVEVTHNDSGHARQFYRGHDAIRLFLSGQGSFVFPSVSNCAVHKSAWEAGGRFDPRFMHQDTTAWLYALVHTNFYYLPDTLTFVRVHAGQVTNYSIRSGHSVTDTRIFYNEYFAKHADELKLDRRTIWQAKARPIAMAALLVRRMGKQGDWGAVKKILSVVPVAWWLAFPAIYVRTAMKEARRTQGLDDKRRPFSKAAEDIAG